MRISKLRDFLVEQYFIMNREGGEERAPILILGGQGLGKTVAIKSAAQMIAQKLGKVFVEYNERGTEPPNELIDNYSKYFVFVSLPLHSIEPVDLTGLLRVSGNMSCYIPPSWAQVLSRCAGLLFLDDYLDVPRPDIKAASHRVFGERTVGFTKLHPEVMILAASNTAKYSSLSEPLPNPLLNKLIVIEVEPPTVDEWANYMFRQYGDRWDKRVYLFLKAHEDEMYIFRPPKETATFTPHPTPRSWTKVARQLYLKPETETEEILRGCIGEEMGVRLLNFLSANVDLSELIAQPKKFHELDINAKYVALHLLASGYEGKAHKRYSPLLREIAADSMEFIVLLFMIMNRNRREQFATNCSKIDPDIYQRLSKGLEIIRQVVA